MLWMLREFCIVSKIYIKKSGPVDQPFSVCLDMQAGLLMDLDYVRGATEVRAGSSEAVEKWDNLRQPDGMYDVPYYFETDPRKILFTSNFTVPIYCNVLYSL